MSEVSLVDGHIDETRMTDEDIIKALECCEGKEGVSYCQRCPFYEYDNCVHHMSQNSRELINRQKAEIKQMTELEHKAYIDFAEELKEILGVKKFGLIDSLAKKLTEKER